MVVTSCCGCRMYLRTQPTFCLSCDRPIAGVEVAKERDLSHLSRTSTVTRYWS
jgi:hypothetical protein